MKYKIHQLNIRMTHPENLEEFLNTLNGEVIAIIPNSDRSGVDFVLIVERFK